MNTTLTNRSKITDETPGAKARALVVAAGPVLLTAALLWHPPLPGRLPDSAGVAEAASAGIMRWGFSHMAAALASGAVAVAFVAVRGYLRERGDGSVSAVGLGLVLIGSTLFAMLPGMEFAVVAAHETGADLAETQAALESWFVPILVVAAVTFAFGTVLFAVAVVRAASFARLPTLIVAGALVVFGLSRIVPVGVVQFYVQSVAAVVALLPLAVAIGAARQRPVPVDTRT
ncbi:hypothetical protein [Jiangella gansuensis]|uniref:hypothetical protein n=1 Tax=Jiangella gansuensis TaxID=281473 RepID=UPI00068630A2|nr:hypothetical protein [Jiangella gansuensis]